MSNRSEFTALRGSDRSFRLRSPGLVWAACLAAFALVSVSALALVSYCVVSRFTYPFELSWMEGAFVDHAARLAAGKPVYEPPSAEFVALIYTPIYHYATSWGIRAGLDGFTAARAVSLIGVFGSVMVCTWLVYRGTRHKWLCACVPPLVAATYFDVDAYYDVGRPDNLMLLFCALSVAAMTFRSTAAAVVLFIPFALAAIFTKQSAFIFFAVFLIGLFFVRRRAAVIGGVGLAVASAAAIYWANMATDGWFRFYVIELPSRHHVTHTALAKSLVEDFLGCFALPTLALILAVVALLFTRKRAKFAGDAYERNYRVILMGALAAAAFSCASIWNVGGARNVLIPYAVFSAAFAPLALAKGLTLVAGAQARAVGWRLALVGMTVAVLSGLKDPRVRVPTAEDVAAWKQFQELLASYGPPERVWVMYHGAAYESADGRTTRPHMVAVADFVGGFGGSPELKLPEELAALVEQRYFNAIVSMDASQLGSLLGRYYKPDSVRAPFSLPEFSGWKPGKEIVWVPCE